MAERSKDTLIKQMYSGMIQRNRNRGHGEIPFTFDEFKTWIDDQMVFDKLYKKWVDSGCDKDLVPSIDRLDSSIGYIFSNMELVTWNINFRRAVIEFRIPVVQLDLNGRFIASFESAREADAKTDVPYKSISLAILNKAYTAYNYIWMTTSDYDSGKSKEKTIKVINRLNSGSYGTVIYRLNVDGTNPIRYKTITEAAKAVDGQVANIAKTAKGERRVAHNYIWLYEPDFKQDVIDERVRMYSETATDIVITHRDNTYTFNTANEALAFLHKHGTNIGRTTLISIASDISRKDIYYLRDIDKYHTTHKSNGPILMFDTNGNVIGEYATMSDAVRETNLPEKTIDLILRNGVSNIDGNFFLYRNTATLDNIRKAVNNVHISLSKINSSSKIRQYSLTGELLAVHNSASIAALKLGFASKSVAKAARKIGATSGECIWIYDNEFTEQLLKDNMASVLKEGEGRSASVKEFTLEGEFVKEHKSIRHASEEKGVSIPTLRKAANGTKRKSVDRLWIFSNEYTDELLKDKIHRLTFRKK